MAEEQKKEEKTAIKKDGGLTVELEEPADLTIFLFPLIGGLVFVLAFMVYLSPSAYDSIGGGMSYTWWRNIAIIAMVILLIFAGLMYLFKMPEPSDAKEVGDKKPAPKEGNAPGKGTAPKKEAAQKKEGGKKKVFKKRSPVKTEGKEATGPTVEEETDEVAKAAGGAAAGAVAGAEKEGTKTTTVEYPKKITGGIYGDVILEVGGNTNLKVRTLLARACLLCDNQEKCFRDFEMYISHEVFLANSDCKRYLNDLKSGVVVEEEEEIAVE